MQGEMDIRKGESTTYHYHLPHPPPRSSNPPPQTRSFHLQHTPSRRRLRFRLSWAIRLEVPDPTSSNNQTAGELVLAVTYIPKRHGLEEDDHGLYERTGEIRCAAKRCKEDRRARPSKPSRDVVEYEGCVYTSIVAS